MVTIDRHYNFLYQMNKTAHCPKNMILMSKMVYLGKDRRQLSI